MKNKIAIASAFIAATSFSTAEIVINDFLSFEGFVDMSYSHIDIEDGSTESDNSFGLDQVEISWLFDFDTVTAQIDLQYEGDRSGDSTDSAVEQAFATYHFDNGGAISAGRFASMLGFEAFEPTGLYQYSTAYSFFSDALVLPGYNQGVKYTQEGDNTFFGISIQDSVTNYTDGGLGGDKNDFDQYDGWGTEIAAAYYMDNGLSFFLGGAFGDSDTLGDYWVVNAYTTFETGAWIFAAEINFSETDSEFDSYDTDGISALIMANFAYSDAASITGRISYFETEYDLSSADYDGVAYTLAHSYAFTDNLLLVTEVSYADIDEAGTDVDALLGAVELIFSF